MYCSARKIITAEKPTKLVIAAWKKISDLNIRQVDYKTLHSL